MGLRDTYAHAIQTAKGKFQGNAEEREGKLYFKGTVATEAEKNEIWTAIKTIPTWQKDVVADIQVTGGPAPSASARSAPAQPSPGPSQDVHRQGRRHAQPDCQGASRQRRGLYENLRAEQRPVDGSGQDQTRAGPASSVTRRFATCGPILSTAEGTVGPHEESLAAPQWLDCSRRRA